MELPLTYQIHAIDLSKWYVSSLYERTASTYIVVNVSRVISTFLQTVMTFL